MEGKSRKSFDVDLRAQGKSIKLANNGIIEGEMKSEKEIDLEIVIKSSECGE